MPKEMLAAKLPLQKRDLPVFTRSENLVACVWQVTKRVNFLSNVDTTLTIDKAVKSRGWEGGHRTVEKPVMTERYNSKMGWVDCLDQMLGTYQYPQKCLKWYHTLYHRVWEIALVNGFILYKKASPTKKITPKNFREEVISGLLKTWNPPQHKTGHSSNTPDPLRLTGRQFLRKNQNPKPKIDCRVCSDRKNKKRAQTFSYCKQCTHVLCSLF